jgi:hypothetical protein
LPNSESALLPCLTPRRAVVGTIALIAIPSLIFGFWPQIKKALQEPTPAGGGPGGRGWRREKIAYQDPSALSRRQLVWVWVWVFAGWPVAILYAACVEPEGRERSEWVNVCPRCGLREGDGHTRGCPHCPPPADPAPPQPRRCRSCSAAQGEYHDPDRCTDQAALPQQAIDLTRQLIWMKEDEIFVKTAGAGTTSRRQEDSRSPMQVKTRAPGPRPAAAAAPAAPPCDGRSTNWDLVDAHTNNRYHAYWTLAQYNASWAITRIVVLHISPTTS